MTLAATRQVIADALQDVGKVTQNTLLGNNVGFSVEIVGPLEVEYGQSVSGKRFEYELTVIVSIPNSGTVEELQRLLDVATDPNDSGSVYRLLTGLSLTDPLKQLVVTRCQRPPEPDSERGWVALFTITCVEVYTP